MTRISNSGWTRIAATTLLCVLWLAAAGQAKYAQDTLQAFAQVYLAQKGIVLHCDTMIRSWLAETGMSEERYGAILRSVIREEDPELSAEERAAVESLRTKAVACEDEHLDWVRQQCMQYDLDYATYMRMLEAYRSEVAFQQVLRPFFSEEIERRTHD